MAAVKQSLPDKPDHSQEGRQIKVLLVDDSPTIHAKYKPLLESCGYLVESAKSVAQALMSLAGRSFDIAIIDYYMPEANGDVLCRMLREDQHTRDTMTAVFTGTNSEAVVRSALEAGASECLFKSEPVPLFLARIDAMSRNLLARKAAETGRRRLDGILNSVGEGVFGTNPTGQITFINPAGLRILRYMNDRDLLGKSPDALLQQTSGVSEERAQLSNAFSKGSDVHNLESVFIASDGQAISVECTVRPLRISGRHHGSVVVFRDITERKAMQERLQWEATHDPVTSLANRFYFEQQLHNEVHRIRRYAGQSALLYIDLDRFKYVNDTAGHAAGDQLLVEVSGRLRERTRQSDILARIGGDEFAVILRDVTLDEAKGVAETFRMLLQDYLFLHNSRIFDVTGSIGIAMFDSSTVTPDEVLSDADIACHIAKTRGRNMAHLFQPEDEDKKNMDIELGWFARLQYALELDRFQLLFQPIVPLEAAKKYHTSTQRIDFSPGEPEHYELLLRYISDDGELVVPSAFLPVAERFGLMHAIDRWVVKKALAVLSDLHKKDRNVQFSINLSGTAFEDEELLPLIETTLKEMKLEPSALTFEITENAAITSLEAAQNFIKKLKEFGCNFALDDFGIGFSSFAHLKYLPVDVVKIDGTFIRDMASDPVDCALVRAINDIAHVLGKKTVAEFVESDKILAELEKSNIDFAQGHYISPPLTQIAGMSELDKSGDEEEAAPSNIDFNELPDFTELSEFGDQIDVTRD